MRLSKQLNEITQDNWELSQNTETGQCNWVQNNRTLFKGGFDYSTLMDMTDIYIRGYMAGRTQGFKEGL